MRFNRHQCVLRSHSENALSPPLAWRADEMGKSMQHEHQCMWSSSQTCIEGSREKDQPAQWYVQTSAWTVSGTTTCEWRMQSFRPSSCWRCWRMGGPRCVKVQSFHVICSETTCIMMTLLWHDDNMIMTWLWHDDDIMKVQFMESNMWSNPPGSLVKFFFS